MSKLRYIKLNASERLEVLRNNGLFMYLFNLDIGREETPHSWLYEHIPTKVVLDRWKKIFKSKLPKSEFSDLITEFDFRVEEKTKDGGQGKIPPIMTPEAQEAIEPLYAESPSDDEFYLEQYFSRAADFAKTLFGANNVARSHRRPITKVLDSMRERDT